MSWWWKDTNTMERWYWIDHEHGKNGMSPGCNMTGRCGGCNGSGVVYQEVPLSQQELQAIDQRIKEYNQKAFSRMK